jgi:hypothetical protein
MAAPEKAKPAEAGLEWGMTYEDWLVLKLVAVAVGAFLYRFFIGLK